MVVLFCSVTAFADSFNALDQKILLKGERLEDLHGADPEALRSARQALLDPHLVAVLETWLDSWQEAFRASIGDFDWPGHLDYFGRVDWLVFFFAVLFMIVLMLNLLISIIAEAQNAYTASRSQ